MLLPTPAPADQTPQLGLASIVYRTAQSPPAAGGIATASFTPVEAGREWLVDRLMVTIPGGGTAYLYDDPALQDAHLLDGTLSGSFDIAEYPNGMLIAENTQLVVRWIGATNGKIGTARAQVRIQTPSA